MIVAVNRAYADLLWTNCCKTVSLAPCFDYNTHLCKDETDHALLLSSTAGAILMLLAVWLDVANYCRIVSSRQSGCVFVLVHGTLAMSCPVSQS